MSSESVKGLNSTHNLIPDWQNLHCLKHRIRIATVTHCSVDMFLVIDTPQMQLSPGSRHENVTAILQGRGHSMFLNVST